MNRRDAPSKPRGQSTRGGGSKGIAGRTGDKPKKEPILDLAPLMDTRLCVSIAGGRECTGILKGYDPLQNLVLDDCVEGGGRRLGLVVVRGTVISVIGPERFEIENPF
jgi:U6 snRNA-associated Sm-like protein LSm7